MGFKNKEKDFVFYVSRDRKPVKLFLNKGRYMRIARKSGNKTSSRVQQQRQSGLGGRGFGSKKFQFFPGDEKFRFFQAN